MAVKLMQLVNDHVFEYVFTFEVAKTANITQFFTINAQKEILKRFFSILNQVRAKSEFSSCHSRISYPSLTVR